MQAVVVAGAVRLAVDRSEVESGNQRALGEHVDRHRAGLRQ
jgi:hypothetical protein